MVLVSGCQAPAQPTGPADVVLHIPDYEAFFDASSSLLRRFDFPPDRVDRARGLIVSQPATSGQWFEWWRVDSQGGYQLLESSLRTMQRIITVNIEPLDGGPASTAEAQPFETQPTSAPAAAAGVEEGTPLVGGRYRVRVQVDKFRHSAPERQITTASGALMIYNERIPTVEGLRGARSRGAHWVPLGRDPLLETFFLEKLSHALPDVAAAQ